MPPKVFIIPNASSSSSENVEVITLPHPNTSLPTRYLLTSLGPHEIRKVTSSTSINVPRSWLFTSTTLKPSSDYKVIDDQLESNSAWVTTGQILSEPSVYISTPIDPLFLLLPHLLARSHYLPLDDLIDTFIENDSTTKFSSHWKRVFRTETKCEERLKERIKEICDTVDAGGEMSYRINKERILNILVKKCEKMAGTEESPGFPKSLEEEYVKKELAKPGEEISIEENNEAGKDDNKKENCPHPQLPIPEEPFTESERTILPLPITRATLPSIPRNISRLLRLRLSSTLLCSYLPPSFHSLFTTHLSTIHSFEPLDIYLSAVASHRREALALRATDFSIKRTIEDDEEANEMRKRKKMEEAEKKKKKKKSKGSRGLSKANTKGMAKMESFFKKEERGKETL